MKALVVDDQLLFNRYLCHFLSKFYNDVRGVGTLMAAEEQLRLGGYELTILDILLPDGDGFEFVSRAHENFAGLKIIGISADCTEYAIHRMSLSGLNVFVDKNDPSPESLAKALRAAVGGGKYFSPSVVAALHRLRNSSDSFIKRITRLEMAVLSKVGLGWSNEAIGGELNIAPMTVDWHCRQLMRRLSLKNRSDLIVYANEKGIARLHPFLR